MELGVCEAEGVGMRRVDGLELSSQTLRARGLRMFLRSAGRVWGVSLSVGISFRGSSACRVQAVDIEGVKWIVSYGFRVRGLGVWV